MRMDIRAHGARTDAADSLLSGSLNPSDPDVEFSYFRVLPEFRAQSRHSVEPPLGFRAQNPQLARATFGVNGAWNVEPAGSSFRVLLM